MVAAPPSCSADGDSSRIAAALAPPETPARGKLRIVEAETLRRAITIGLEAADAARDGTTD